MGLEMELLIAISAFVLVDVLAIRFGIDTRPSTVTADEWAATRGK